MDMKRHLKSALKQLGFDKPRKAQIIPRNTLDAEQDAIVIAATGSGKQVAELACHAVVVLPRGIQAVHFAAPCVEASSMTRRSPLPLTTKIGKLGTRVVVLPFRAQNGHEFALNGFNHAQKGFACGIGAVLSRIGTFRPDHQAVFMRRKFHGHIKPVLRGCGM